MLNSFAGKLQAHTGQQTCQPVRLVVSGVVRLGICHTSCMGGVPKMQLAKVPLPRQACLCMEQCKPPLKSSPGVAGKTCILASLSLVFATQATAAPTSSIHLANSVL